MNYSTLKKTVAFSFASLMVAGAVSAQTPGAGATGTTPKLFGGAGQFSTWSIGINAGVTSPMVFTGGSSDFQRAKLNLGYGVSVKKQISHGAAIQLDVRGGKVGGKVPDTDPIDVDAGKVFPFVQDGVSGYKATSFSTKFWQGSLSAVINIASMDFLHRENAINFYGKAGVGLVMYKPSLVGYTGSPDFTFDHNIKEWVVPVGIGVKFKLSDVVALDLGYTENFVDGDNFDGIRKGYPTKDRWGYNHVGLDFTLGGKTKPSLEWANPVAIMYDELYDAALRQEVEALKGRVTNVEKAVSDLKKDTDGDGVADQFDKCPGTPAGTVVDGGGCPIVFPKADSTAAAAAGPAAYSNIQFEFDSSVLRTSSYPVLDATSADLRASGSSVEVDGFASSEGTAAHNLKLSRDRANSVKTYLVNSGVAASKVTVKAFGETQPIADNSTEEGRVINRRVQFKK